MSLLNYKAMKLVIAAGLIGTIAMVIRADDSKVAPAPDDAQPVPAAVLRIYDIRALIGPNYDLSLDSSPHSAAFVTPANLQSGTFDFRLTGQRYPSRDQRATPARQERIDELCKLVTDTVAPDSWRDAGGPVGTLREINDMLVVTTSLENQKQIAALLKELKQRNSETVRACADWIILPRDDVSKILKPASHAGKESRAPAEVDSAALAKLPATTRHFHAELLCLNGQTVAFVSGREQTVTVTQTAIVGTGVTANQPLIGTAGTGIALQIRPVIDRERGKASVTVFSTFNDADKLGPLKPLKSGPSDKLRTGPTTQASSGPIAATQPSAAYRELNGVVQEFRTSVRIPLGVPILVGSMTLEPAAKNAVPDELVMILSVQSAE